MTKLPKHSAWHFGAVMRFLALLVIGWLSTGCIVLPTPGRIDRRLSISPGGPTGPNVDIRKLVGTADSDRPIRRGVTYRQVHATLGEPYYRLPEGNARRGEPNASFPKFESYDYYSYNWLVILLIPVGPYWGDVSVPKYIYDLTLDYDDDGRVRAVFLYQRQDFGETPTALLEDKGE